MSEWGDFWSEDGGVSRRSFSEGKFDVKTFSTVFASRADGFESSMGGREKRNKTSIRVPEISTEKVCNSTLN